MRDRVILDLCAGSGAWSRPYAEAGYLVVRVDMIDSAPKWIASKRIARDVRDLAWMRLPVGGILAAPPCTVFASSGARWQRTPEQIRDALSVVDACLLAVAIYGPEWWALENPIWSLRRWLGPPTMRFDPCDYGDPYTKRTQP